jgi:hypothetical protein
MGLHQRDEGIDLAGILAVHHTCGILAEIAPMRAQPAVRREAIIDGGRELVLGAKPIVDGDDDSGGVLSQARAEDVMCVEVERSAYPWPRTGRRAAVASIR